MHDAAAMSKRDRVADLGEQPQVVAELLEVPHERAFTRDDVAERIAAHELHVDVVQPVLVGPELVHRNDVGVVELRGDLGLVEEELELVGVLNGVGIQDLQRRPPQQPQIFDSPHRALAPAGDLAVIAEVRLDVGLGRGLRRLDPRRLRPHGLSRWRLVSCVLALQPLE